MICVIAVSGKRIPEFKHPSTSMGGKTTSNFVPIQIAFFVVSYHEALLND